MDEKEYNNITDHEAVLLISKDIKYIKESQENFHKEMRESFDELKNNYQGRLLDHDTRITNLESTRTDFRLKISNTDTYLKWLLIASSLLFSIMCWHILGYHL